MFNIKDNKAKAEKKVLQKRVRGSTVVLAKKLCFRSFSKAVEQPQEEANLRNSHDSDYLTSACLLTSSTDAGITQ